MGDTISRSAAIAEIEEYIEEYSELDRNGLHSQKWCAMEEAKDVLLRLPAVGMRTDAWISVADRLPTDEAPVLVYYGFKHCTGLGRPRFFGVLTYYAFAPQPHWQHESTGLRVTHWMPLTEPPKGGTGDGEADTVQH